MKMQGVGTLLLIFCYLDVIFSLELNYSLLEESEPNSHVIGNIAEDSGLLSLLSSSENRKYIRYSIVSDDSPLSDYFWINQTTSDLYNSVRLDRESIEKCKYIDTCSLPLVIIAQSTENGISFFQKITTNIIILDINDQTPSFPKNQTSIKISESSVIDSVFPIDSASDSDKGENSIQKYKIVPLGSPFTLRYTQFVDGSSSVNIVLAQKLDREIENTYSLRILAIDGGQSPRTGTLYLGITVADENDNEPRFAQDTYRITVSEDIAVGHTIIVLNATDKDEGNNGKISYQLSPYQPEEIRKLFAIDGHTGALTISQSLMYTPGTEHKVVIEASDNAAQPLTSQAVVYVTVQDSMNDPPEIHINFLTPTGPTISESTRTGSAIAHVAVVDTDTGNNGIVTCTIQGTVLRLQDLGQDEYKLVLNASIDREIVDKYDVVLVCQDKGSPPLKTTKPFTITVADVNDNYPIFSHDSYIAEIYENNDVGTRIFKVHATDKDAGHNARIDYSFANGDNRFMINASTGEIFANFQLDRENRSRYNFVVMATDNGDPKKSTQATLQLNVLDRNDNKPVFDFSIYTFTVLENQPPGMYIGNVSASDIDAERNSLVEYAILMSTINELPFTIFPNGSIYSTKSLDREENLNGYNFKIVARDKGEGVALKSTCHVTVFVADVNDNNPTFLFPNAENYTLIVIYDIPPNSIVGKIEAVDKDYGANAEVTFSFIDTEEKSSPKLFEIDSNTGDIYLTRGLSRSDMNRYVMTINAMDHGNPKLSTNQSLVIVVTSHVLSPESQDGGSGSDSYMLIAVIISCITVIVAGVIVLFIFLLRRHDKNKNKSHNSNPPSRPGNVVENDTYDALEKKRDLSLVTTNQIDDGSISRNSSPNTSQEQLLGYRQNSFRSQPSTCISDDDVEKILDRITPETRESFSSFCPSVSSDHQYIQRQQLSSFAKSPPNSKHKVDFRMRTMDNYSESSVESNTSDSGRGGSDCDVHSNGTPTITDEHAQIPNPHFRHPKDRKSPYQSQESIRSDSSKSRAYSKPNEYANLPYKHSQRNPQYNNKMNNIMSRLYDDLSDDVNSRKHTGSSEFRREKELPYLHHKHKPTVHWKKDSSGLHGSVITLDDDVSTTTSGSYTVDDSGNECVYTVV